MAAILVSGYTGFVGSHLVRVLVERKNDVHVIVRPESSLSDESWLEKISVYEYNQDIYDLADYMRNNSVEVVIHLASLFIAEHKTEDINKLIDSNIRFGTHILEAMKLADVSKIINTGTSWQHYNNLPYNPVCLYAATKEAFETLVEYYHQAKSISVITLKLFDTYGENDQRPKLINLLNKFSREGVELEMSAGEQLIDLVYIHDVIEAYQLATNRILDETKPINESFAVSSGTQISLRELVAQFEEITGKRLNIQWGKRSYREREVMIPWLNYETLPGWQPKVSLKDGLKRIFISS
ncbi:Nucleoside-diphosphate-sugar epimerase [Reichenbachiella faecimaris]|uniref:Nucleoside-diphosphate-sugar epimerase n=1 Tax=Reichenbachiella faecimaris TaxID=692418 RepID=A0A1W2GCV9_REIFA|nr:NAD(P)-dependent oxidoreductase [Reichenbachiella faecimaris]SMD34354.1 Nucleoside-diphosphate-sugar epimerase [Reichenbachiella faecimaris]